MKYEEANNSEYVDKRNLLVQAWNGIQFEGAELLFNYSKMPEVNPDWDWPDSVDFDDLPAEAFTENLIDVWTVAWKATINGKKYGHWIKLTEPTAHPDVVETLRKHYELFLNANLLGRPR